MTAIRIDDVNHEKAATKPPLRKKKSRNDTIWKQGFWWLWTSTLAMLLTSMAFYIYMWATAPVHTFHWTGFWTCDSRAADMRTPEFDAQCMDQLNEFGDRCSVTLVESIPQGIYVDGTGTMPTFQAFKDLILSAEHSIQIASSYWSLRAKDTRTDPDEEPTTDKGQEIYELLYHRAKYDDIQIQIAQNKNDSSQPDWDTTELAKLKNVQVKSLNFPHLVGAGILHTKMMLVDGKHFYVGSNNFDWRSFTQVKEMGVLTVNCPKLGADMQKLFDIYWMVGGENQSIPDKWPHQLDTNITRASPLTLHNMDMSAYLGSSPEKLCTDNRDTDLSSILKAIKSAEKYVYIAVMDFFPVTIYQKDTQYFPWIDNELREAAIERGVDVRLLLSNWTSTRPSMIHYLKSLTVISQKAQTSEYQDNSGFQSSMQKDISIRGRYFTVPKNESQAKIPYARVNHNKYIITDKEAIIMTSNWSADYFLYTGGIAFGFTPSTADNNTDTQWTGTKLHKQLQNVFLRDWESPYASIDL